MGYTHYFTQLKPCPADAWDKICSAFAGILFETDIPVNEECDMPNAVAVVNEDEIRFNGVGEDGHETMLLIREAVEFHFCKTAQKPYDDLVTALLTIADKYAPGVWRIGSDGSPEEWAAGVALAAKACDGAECPLKEEAQS